MIHKNTPRQYRLLTAALVVVVLLVLAGPVTAAPDSPGNSTETATPNATQVTDQLGDLVIHDYWYSDGQVVLDVTWRGSTPTTATVSERASLDSSGTATIGFTQVRLLPGDRTEIAVDATKEKGVAAVGLTTPQSVDNGNGKLVQVGSPDTSIFDRPATWATAQVSGAAGFSGGFIAFVLVSWFKLRGGRKGVEKVA
ncbi:hypothetical protein [Halorhabdus salina]|uniref:hypothetical protein n=1 Tax=Halorhabdus salina TaxID=2750670 RepID=UPI0015EF1236|nr:hypothetical protein [Halorhabdus salina]